MYEIRAEKQFNVVLNGIDCFYDISVLRYTLCALCEAGILCGNTLGKLSAIYDYCGTVEVEDCLKLSTIRELRIRLQY